jgi:hypothetical protein
MQNTTASPGSAPTITHLIYSFEGVLQSMEPAREEAVFRMAIVELDDGDYLLVSILNDNAAAEGDRVMVRRFTAHVHDEALSFDLVTVIVPEVV